MVVSDEDSFEDSSEFCGFDDASDGGDLDEHLQDWFQPGVAHDVHVHLYTKVTGHQARSLMQRAWHLRIKATINRHQRARSARPPSPPSNRRQSAAAPRPSKSPPTNGLRRVLRLVSFLKNFKASRCFIPICNVLGWTCSRPCYARGLLWQRLLDQRPLQHCCLDSRGSHHRSTFCRRRVGGSNSPRTNDGRRGAAWAIHEEGGQALRAPCWSSSYARGGQPHGVHGDGKNC
jgi:hypothetical protein